MLGSQSMAQPKQEMNAAANYEEDGSANSEFKNNCNILDQENGKDSFPQDLRKSYQIFFREGNEWDMLHGEPSADENLFLEDQNNENKFLCQLVGFVQKILKMLFCVTIFIGVISFGVISKSSVLFMTSQINFGIDIGTTVPSTNKLNTNEDEAQTRVLWFWALFFSFSIPEILTWLYSCRICIFRKWKIPPLSHFLVILFFETSHTLGLSMLILCVLPNMENLVQGAVMCHWVCLMPSIIWLLSESSRSKKGPQRAIHLILNITVVLIQLGGSFSMPIIKMSTNQENETHWTSWLSPLAFSLVSFGWWENYVVKDSQIGFLKYLGKLKKEMETPLTRYVIYSFVSIWKILVFFCSMVWIEWLISRETSHIFSTDLITKFKNHHTMNLTNFLSVNHPTETSKIYAIPSWPLTPFYMFVIQTLASLLCFLLGKLACKINIQKIGYALPVNLIPPVSLSILAVLLINQGKLDAQHVVNDVLIWLCMIGLVSQIWITIYIWTSECPYFSTTEQLFVNPFYCSLLIDQSMSFNRRKDESGSRLIKTEELRLEAHRSSVLMADSIPVDSPATDNVTRIYTCATMWHETADEMATFLKSIFGMDKDHSSRCMAQQIREIIDRNYYEFETHIFFDDAFESLHKEGCMGNLEINSFVKQLVKLIQNGAASAYKDWPDLSCIKTYKIYSTPYGGRFVWTLPGKTKLVVHLKNKDKIRQTKRWSQVMYMFYLLGYELSSLPVSNDRKETIASNAFLLTVDGDTGFKPEAVHLLIELMKRNRLVGAACGRIHPKGSGWMVWYQRFEYAFCHWLQKSTEHVIGCVLCTPGCFSLFRGRALMDRNVIGQYSSPSSNANQYIQFEKGEDRWLCTLLLQAGYKVEYSASSDSYTHCPDGFCDFFKQRARWIPSTLANTLNLIKNCRKTIHVNDNISFLYILYQAVLVISTILAPGTIFLVLVISLVRILHIQFWVSTIINLIPVVAFVIACFTTRPQKQLLFAEILSSFYVLIIVAVMMDTIFQFRNELETGSLSAIFGLVVCAWFAVAACLHPQEMWCIFPGMIYLLMLPSTNLLLFLYSMINLNNTSWGTRETSRGEKETCTKDTKSGNPFDSTNISQPPSPEIVGEEVAAESKQPWMEDDTFLNGQIKTLCREEVTFWNSLIKKYLDPNEKGKKEQNRSRILDELFDLRNKSIVFILLVNAIFILILLMLQINLNISVFIKEYLGLQVETINLILFVFLGLIFAIQLIGMILHRFETLCQILAHTDIARCGNRKRGE